MRSPTTSLVLVLVGGVLLMGVTPMAAADNSTENGIPANETAIYFSEDSDNYTSDSEYYELTGTNRSVPTALANGTDIFFSRPPEQVEIWNSNDFETLQSDFSTDTDTSIRPEGATTRDGDRFLTDAHVSLYRISPSTELHSANGESEHYVGRSGTVRALVDYRIDHPLDDVDPTDGKLIEWKLLDSSIDQTCLIEANQPPENGCTGQTLGSEKGDTHTPEFEYTILGSGKADTALTAVSEIDVEFQKIIEIEKTKTKQICREVGTESGTETRCTTKEITYWDKITKRFDESVVVYDTIEPVNTQRSQQMIQEIIYPDGQRDYGVNIEGRPWGQIQSENNLSATSRWRYFSRGGENWQTVIADTKKGESEIDMGAIPLRTHAFPYKQNEFGSYSAIDEPDITQLTATEISNPPQFPEYIQLPVSNGTYTYTNKFAIIDARSYPDLQTKTIVRDDEAITVGGPTTRIRATNLEMEILDQNTSHVLIQARLTENETGDPISLQNRKGNITVRGINKKTNSSGYTQFLVNQSSVIKGKYHPSPWYDTDHPIVFADSSALVAPANTDLYTKSVTNLIKIGAQGLPFILLMAFLIDMLPYVNMWPPWRYFP